MSYCTMRRQRPRGARAAPVVAALDVAPETAAAARVPLGAEPVWLAGRGSHLCQPQAHLQHQDEPRVTWMSPEPSHDRADVKQSSRLLCGSSMASSSTSSWAARLRHKPQSPANSTSIKPNEQQSQSQHHSINMSIIIRASASASALASPWRRAASRLELGRTIVAGALLVALLGLLASGGGLAGVHAQSYKPEWPASSLQQEIFLLNLEDGYFGCQVNESQDFLQLFELSRLCDGQTQCFKGSDELHSLLKCRDRKTCGAPMALPGTGSAPGVGGPQGGAIGEPANTALGAQRHHEPVECVNGVCLDGLCYCNDGFGGKSCDVADENECKFRPCDVFAHCTNTMGSYYCSCFPGYDGDGMNCQDINECEIPSLAALCSDNSECCNLPGHFVCKCKPGYQQAASSALTGPQTGNATVSCTDIDECLDERSCGKGAICENLPGSFRCSCPHGFVGDPSVECIDMDECKHEPCGQGAQCTNTPGGYRCSCAPGFERSQQALVGGPNSNVSQLVACVDINECKPGPGAGGNPCGLNAQCVNTQGGYFCQCPPNFTGNPKVSCVDIDECASVGCGPNAQCQNLAGSYSCECKPGYSGNAFSTEGCQDDDECARKGSCGANAQCFNSPGSFECFCPTGYTGDPYTQCSDVDECAQLGVAGSRTLTGGPCGPGSKCTNLPGSFRCSCLDKFTARSSGELGCERSAVDVGCSMDSECSSNALCVNSTCQCRQGFQPTGSECVDIDECALSQPLSLHRLGRALGGGGPGAAATPPASNSSALCGPEAQCVNTEGAFRCECRAGYEKLDPRSPTSKCRDVNECEAPQQADAGAPATGGNSSAAAEGPCGPNALCYNTDGAFTCSCRDGFVPVDGTPTSGCKSPCAGVNCGPHSQCRPHGNEAACVCKPGFTYDPNNIKLGCVDINECDATYGASGLCGARATCTNLAGSYRCSCPQGFAGDAYRYCEDINECDRKFGVFGQCGDMALCNNTLGSYSCSCASGYSGDPRVKCDDINECLAANPPACGARATCTNLPGKFSCKCPAGLTGDPFVECKPPEAPPCSSSADCTRPNEQCLAGRCQCPFAQPPGSSGSEPPQTDSTCQHPCERIECGKHAQCQLDPDNQPICVCNAGFMAPADGRSGCLDINECISGPLALSGMSSLDGRGGVANPKSASATHPCGINAICRNKPGSFDCVCPSSHSGDPYDACTPTSPPTPTAASTTNIGGAPVSSGQEGRTGSTCREPCARGQVCVEGVCVKQLQQLQLGFDGTPSATATPCKDSSECRLDMHCHIMTQQCTPVCPQSSASQGFGIPEAHCGPNATCLARNHKPMCTCPLGLTGDPYDLVSGCRAPSMAGLGASGTLKAGGAGYSDSHVTTVSSGNPSFSTTMTTTTTTTTPTQTGSPSSGSNQNSNETPANAFELSNNGRVPTTAGAYPPMTTPTTTSTTTSPMAPASHSSQQQQAQMGGQSMMSQVMDHKRTQQVGDPLTTPLTNNLTQVTQPRRPTGDQQFDPQKTSMSSMYNNRSLACTSDQHCPGNLFCLEAPAPAPSLSANGLRASHGAPLGRHCGCPPSYRREADFCYMHRVNCSSSSLCKAREECISWPALHPSASGTPTSINININANQLNFSPNSDANDATSGGICICPRGYKLTPSGSSCVDRNECDEGTPCALGAICQNKVGSYECVCPPGTLGEPYTKTCEPVDALTPSAPAFGGVDCRSNQDCSNDRECDPSSRRCVSPCHVCGPRAICTASNHAAICLCPPKFTGSAIDLVYGCQEPQNTPSSSGSGSGSTATGSGQLAGNSGSNPNSIPGSGTGPLSMSTTQRPMAVGAPMTTLLPSEGQQQQQPISPLQTSSNFNTSLSTTNNPTSSSEPVEFRTIPPSELFVMCLADGIQVELQLGGFDGIIYVKGHSQDPKCRKLVSSSQASEFVDFRVQFGHCDLIHRDGEASFVLVIQKHPKLVTYRARAYHVKCVYNTGERTVTLGFNVSMLATSGTIANTGPAPSCLMSITSLDGREVTSAEIGQDLLLRVDVQPDSIYGGFARSCEAKTADDDGEYQYEVTDAQGCATDPSIFSEWSMDAASRSLVARFNAFKFPSSNNLRFQCNIRVCFGQCPPVNCNGVDALGRRRRRRREAPAIGAPQQQGDSAAGASRLAYRLNSSNNNHSTSDNFGGLDEADADFDPQQNATLVASDSRSYREGALRDEIMVQSNAILTFDRKEPPQTSGRSSAAAHNQPDFSVVSRHAHILKAADDSVGAPDLRPYDEEDMDFVCLPKLAGLLSMALGGLLVIVVASLASSWWHFRRRRRLASGHHRHPLGGPMSHPSDFPNPIGRASSCASSREPIYGP